MRDTDSFSLGFWEKRQWFLDGIRKPTYERLLRKVIRFGESLSFQDTIEIIIKDKSFRKWHDDYTCFELAKDLYTSAGYSLDYYEENHSDYQDYRECVANFI